MRQQNFIFTWKKLTFKAITQLVSLEKAPDALHKNAGQVGIGDALYVIYIYDETEIVHYIRENYDQRVNVVLLYIDNYDEPCKC